jgi:hypothetical protein
MTGLDLVHDRDAGRAIEIFNDGQHPSEGRADPACICGTFASVITPAIDRAPDTRTGVAIGPAVPTPTATPGARGR